MDEYSDPTLNNDLPTDNYDTYVPYEPQYEEHTYDSWEIRLCIFLITTVCVGLPALVWAFRLLHLHRKIRGRISAFILLLLLTDLIQLLINLYIVTIILIQYRDPNLEIILIWLGLNWCGFHLHHLVALEGVSTLTYPLFSARIFSLPCYIIISIIVLILSAVSVFLFVTQPIVNMRMLLFSLGISLTPLLSLVVTFTITCKASSTPVSKNTRSMFAVAIVNFVMLYLPFMLVTCVHLFHMYRVDISWHMMCLCLISLRVISDPILCVLVCRGNLRDVQTPQTHTEPNADETSV